MIWNRKQAREALAFSFKGVINNAPDPDYWAADHVLEVLAKLPVEITDEMVDRAADVAYGVYHPATQPRFTGKERAWRGPIETNPMRRAIRAALESALEMYE